MQSLVMLAVLSAGPSMIDTFHGWSKDGTYLVYEHRGSNDLVELFFCQTDQTVKPTWPAALHDMDTIDMPMPCVRFIDPNKAPYQWKTALVLPKDNEKAGFMKVNHELVTDGDSPGFVVESGGKQQTCYVSGLREDSKLQKVYWHPNGKWVAALVDGSLSHCAVQLKAQATAKGPAPKKK